MTREAAETRPTSIKDSLIHFCQVSGILADEDIEDFYHDDLIEAGIVDSMGIVCLQDQIENHYNVVISLDQFVAEFNTLSRLENHLAVVAKMKKPL